MVKNEGWRYDVARSFQYPGGELHLKDVDNLLRDPRAVWVADVRGAVLDDLGYAALLADVAHQRQAPFVLFYPYLPAGRSDHVGSPDPLGVRVYADLVASFNPQQVIGIDPHSHISARYYRNLTALDPTPLVMQSLEGDLMTRGYGQDHPHHWWDGVIAPDKGAVERAGKVAEALGRPLFTADKVRVQYTGKIESITPPEGLDPGGQYLVVDDICDGGGTFIGLAKAMGLSREQLGLWVTHGIFSGNAQNLRGYYNRIYTTDSHPGHNRVGVATSVVQVETYMTQNMKGFG
jgi:ribose-phosphate pyrophosphokinase